VRHSGKPWRRTTLGEVGEGEVRVEQVKVRPEGTAREGVEATDIGLVGEVVLQLHARAALRKCGGGSCSP
jgi:hypothetical protein